MIQLPTAKVWYKTWWGVGLTIIFFYVLVPYLVWTKTSWHKGIKVGITIVCAVIMITGMGDAIKRESEAGELIAQAQTYYQEGNVEKAYELIKKADSLSDQDDNESFAILQKSLTQAYDERKTKLDSPEFLKSTLAEMSDSDFELLQKDQLKTAFIAYEPYNKQFIAKLKRDANKRADYLAELESKKITDKILADIEKQRIAAIERTNLIEKEFWLDGSHYNLTRAIKSSLNDPKSYEHVQTTYQDKGDYLIITTDYRAKNVFGALILKQIVAKVAIDGTILEVLEE